MKWIKYELQTTTAACEVMGERLAEFEVYSYETKDNIPPTPAEEEKMFTDIPAVLPPDTGEATIVFYSDALDTDDDAFYSTGSSLRDETLRTDHTDLALLAQPEQFIAQFQEAVKKSTPFLPPAKISYVIEDDSAWKDKWKEHFQSFRLADDIVIKPVWEEIPSDCSPNDIVLSIEPGSAFGTGTHETTKLCLLSLRKHIQADTRLLDVGCGSGILAIAALLCGASSAFCLDIDPSAIAGTLENAKHNGITPEQLTAIHADILNDTDSVRTQCREPFDVVVANILADVIIPLTPVIGAFLQPDGLFLSSGILAEKAGDVENTLLDNGFTILERNTMGDWVAFVAAKKKA